MKLISHINQENDKNDNGNIVNGENEENENGNIVNGGKMRKMKMVL